MIENRRWPLFRLIIPAFQEVNIYTRIAKRTTALGPIIVASAANKLWGWRVEVIDENNCHRRRKAPLDENGLLDHQKLQQESPATVVGFYGGLSSTMERLWQIAKYYKSQDVITIAGSWHCHYEPEESLKSGIDIVVHGDGELVIQQLLKKIAENKTIEDLAGISYLNDNQEIVSNPPAMIKVLDLNDLPYSDFGLLRFAKMKLYPISRIRGCSKGCEFCSVKGKPRWATGQFLFDQVKWLVETRKAKDFFVVDDRLEENREETMIFFKKIAKAYGRSLCFTVQVRLESAQDKEFLEALKQAGVEMVCIGYESPIDEELKAMNKGYSSKDMLNWTEVYHDFNFLIHAMFIWGYPLKDIKSILSATERLKRSKGFIRKAKLSTVQVLRPIPLVGTGLRRRLAAKNRLFPLGLIPWSKYDGNYVCFQPDNMSLSQLQEMPLAIMKGFYRPISFIKIVLKTLIFPFDWLIRGWEDWYRSWNKDIKHFGAHLLIKGWIKRHKKENFIAKLEKFWLSKKAVT